MSEQRFVGMYRIRNEEQWIQEVIESAFPLCEHVYILDDNSLDRTLEICRGLNPDLVTVYPSPFREEGLDETRDKNYLYQKILEQYPPNQHGQTWPDWICCIDGDEVFDGQSYEIIRKAAQRTDSAALSLRIYYLWDEPDQIRVDGVYADFHRPSIFRVINPHFQWQTTPWKGNLHCSSIPQEFVGQSEETEATLWHYGYITPEIRLRKWEWYNSVDPNNENEDCYLHMLIGDVEGLPPESKTKWAGPLTLRRIPERKDIPFGNITRA